MGGTIGVESGFTIPFRTGECAPPATDYNFLKLQLSAS